MDVLRKGNTIAKYKTKPCEIEAIQFTGEIDNMIELQHFMNSDLRVSYRSHDDVSLLIDTLEGTMAASVGDYIIRGLRGEFYPCKPDVFKKKYELIK